jgi:uncharacterized protein YjdB
MFARCCVRGLLLLCLGTSLVGCSNQGLDSVQVTPATQALTVGQTAQFTATGTYGNASHPSTQNITSLVTWASNAPSVATISATGVATAVGAGTTTITATSSGFNGPISSSATLTVTGTGGGANGGSIASISVIPGTQSVSSPTQTSQFLAIGTTSSGATVNLTNQVTWNSSSTQIATVGATTGLATGVAKGTSTITALYSNASGGTVVTGSATFTIVGGTTQQFTAVTILPSSQTLSTLNETAQFIALATSGTTGLQQDVTSSPQITWTSSNPTIGSVSPGGVAKDLGAGASTITAVLTNSDGSVVSNSATLTTTLTSTPEDLLSMAIIPSSITVGNLQDSGQFLAIGTFSTPPYTRDITNSVQWITSAPNVFPVTTNCGSGAPANCSPAPLAGSQNGGVASAYGNGTGVIAAEYTGTDKATVAATATFACPLVLPTATNPGSCFLGSQAPALLSTLTVYNEGLNNNDPLSNNTNWLVTASSATGTPYVIHCGPGWTNNGQSGGSVCTATYPVGTTVTLTAPPQSGVSFGGWSSNCAISPNPSIATGTNTCTVILSTDETVGAIFN